MTPKEYADFHYADFPTFRAIAAEAFKAGLENSKPVNYKMMERKLKKTKAELKSLWNTIEDPEKLCDLISGL